ncbi:hypothetical protein RA27_02175 [Ruegeria sp. ANG-R]|nr:hypothetical protein RA27_02175 [Ruegeria sp. ANG-R]
MHHSDLMRDDTPGSRNRALTGLHKSKGVKLDFAQALERELLDIAARKGVDIGTWRTDQDSGADDE